MQKKQGERNKRWFDGWSVVHFGSGFVLALFVNPWLAAALLILWEPLELFILGPLAWRLTGRRFGHEAWPNVVGDLVSDGAGLAAGLLLVHWTG